MNDEGGVIVCAWPDKESEPKIPLTYGPEVMCGMEYQVASHMLWEGMEKEAFEIVNTIRDRFDGIVRNPWNEFECGSNYARSLASFALILAASGFEYDLGKHYIGFTPHVYGKDPFKGFFSVADGWGIFCQYPDRCEIRVLYGKLKLKSVKVPLQKATYIEAGEQKISFEESKEQIFFQDLIEIKEGECLTIRK